MPDWYAHPHWALAIVFVLVGFFVLIKGADLLVEGAVAIARKTGMAPAVIGATVVAFGTSLPELAVSVFSLINAGDPSQYASVAESPAAIAMSNVVGSNIFNIGAILGISALVRHLPVPKSTLRIDYPFMIVAMLLLVGFSMTGGQSGEIARWEGGVLLVGLLLFTVLAIKSGGGADELPDEPEDGDAIKPLKAIGLILAGVVMLTVGGDVILKGSVALAETAGMSKRVIGLTVVAIGTSLPELATSMQAARKGQTEIAVANVVGSNCFNVLCICGIASMFQPLPVPEGMITWDYIWMLGFAVALLPLMLTGRTIQRGEGVFLVIALLTYVTLLVAFPSISGGG